MKILLYVTHPERGGAVDYAISPALEAQIREHDLENVALGFLARGAATPRPGTHRLTCASATDDGVLDALGVLAHQISSARAWAQRYDGTGAPPDYVLRLWDKHPRAMYRCMLGIGVTSAIRKAEAAGQLPAEDAP